MRRVFQVKRSRKKGVRANDYILIWAASFFRLWKAVPFRTHEFLWLFYCNRREIITDHRPQRDRCCLVFFRVFFSRETHTRTYAQKSEQWKKGAHKDWAKKLIMPKHRCTEIKLSLSLSPLPSVRDDACWSPVLLQKKFTGLKSREKLLCPCVCKKMYGKVWAQWDRSQQALSHTK